MHEILRELPAGSLVLDIGCAAGSFRQDATAARIVRVDRQASKNRESRIWFVQADAASLPFPNRLFAAVISNHSLEHFDDTINALREIGRVVIPNGSLFVAVPDASSLTDKLYRWIAKGGGHVNAFTSPQNTAAEIERGTGLPHIATKLLYSSLSFLNRRNAPCPSRRLRLLGAGYEWTLFLYSWLSRRLDRLLGVRTSVYGWAFYFGRVAERIDAEVWVNVCIRCGSACSASYLKQQSLVRTGLVGIKVYRCPECGATNPFTNDP